MNYERASNWRIGQRVLCNGYEGAIRELCTGVLDGMAVVQLDRGQVCVALSTLRALN